MLVRPQSLLFCEMKCLPGAFSEQDTAASRTFLEDDAARRSLRGWPHLALLFALASLLFLFCVFKEYIYFSSDFSFFDVFSASSSIFFFLSFCLSFFLALASPFSLSPFYSFSSCFSSFFVIIIIFLLFSSLFLLLPTLILPPLLLFLFFLSLFLHFLLSFLNR